MILFRHACWNSQGGKNEKMCIKALATWKYAMQWLESGFYSYGDVTSVLVICFFFFFPQLKELTIIWAGADPRLLFSFLFPMGTFVAIGIILCNIRAACTAEGGWEKMASFVIIYSVLYLPICTLSDNALLNKRTQEMEYKENVSLNSNICHIWIKRYCQAL